MTNWLPIYPFPPIDPEHDYDSWWESIKVLCHNGKEHFICRLQVWTDEGAISEKYWILDGPDGLRMKDIKAWSYLPPI